ncbi:cytochrome c oxidase subunit II [Aurantimonas sp. 22II-16-19i]|uniref:cytochrome c oxidase subunit II n=1 Tax=Aurantimonas sp. 22II-16-19i TaxID=1317114 RepID=UPI0009F7D0C8|nr:cytochrome c oxidase subunit II [Aurantimonas sp. 22II-16-19i]ORE98886.1 cytochrome c oxidase subunit II [Aurantimonas sp. 22II-16-19i]
MGEVELFLPAASSEAVSTDGKLLGLIVISGLITLLVASLIGIFAVRYRRGSKATRKRLPTWFSKDIETVWTLATAGLFVAIFAWAASQDFALAVPPARSTQIHVVGKQWMWKVEHSGGQREINELHVPAGETIELVLNSQDVIHSFYVPAFRLKQDVVPGHTQHMRFNPTEIGTYHLFCAEYCGTQHSAMIGRVVVMSKEDYADWLTRQPEGDDLQEDGRRLFVSKGCAGCHYGSSKVRAPRLAGVYGSSVPLADGQVVTADDQYIRDSILQPRRDIVAGFEPIMPSFAGALTEGELVSLTAYIRSLAVDETAR